MTQILGRKSTLAFLGKTLSNASVVTPWEN